MQTKVLEMELAPMVDAIGSYSMGYSPKLLYTFVDKNTSHRLFERDNGNFINPGPGTCVDSGLVEN